jgi:hypothetical protein
MDITQLQTGLNNKFATNRIVFWHDPEQSFTTQHADLVLLWNGLPVTVLNMAEQSQLQTRQRIELDEPTQGFCSTGPAQNHHQPKTGCSIYAVIAPRFMLMPPQFCLMISARQYGAARPHRVAQKFFRQQRAYCSL